MAALDDFGRSLLLIRPIEQSRDLEETLRTSLDPDHPPLRTVYSPLVRIEPLQVPINTVGMDGVVFTSANAVREFSQRVADRRFTAFCVGPRTREAAIQAGYVRVRIPDGAGNAAALATLVEMDWRRGGGPYLYVRGQPVATNLAGLLSARSVPVKEIVIYRQAVVPLRGSAQKVVAQAATCVPVYSANAARRLIAELAGLEPYDMVCPCIGDTAGRILAGQPGIRPVVAGRPSGDAMTELILHCLHLE